MGTGTVEDQKEPLRNKFGISFSPYQEDNNKPIQVIDNQRGESLVWLENRPTVPLNTFLLYADSIYPEVDQPVTDVIYHMRYVID